MEKEGCASVLFQCDWTIRSFILGGMSFSTFFFRAFKLEDEPHNDMDDNNMFTTQTTRLTPLLRTCGPYLSRKRLSPSGQQGGQSVWVTGGMFPSSSSSSSSSSTLWPQQDTSSEIMGLCSWLISSFMAHVCGHCTSIQRAAMTGPSKSALENWLDTNLPRPPELKLYYRAFLVHERLYKHHYSEEFTRRLVCHALCYHPDVTSKPVPFNWIFQRQMFWLFTHQMFF